MDALGRTGCICEECRELTEKALAECSPALLSYLRVTAAGKEVHKGQRVARGKWHLEMHMGRCSRWYASTVRGRAAQFGMDADLDIVWLSECPPTQDAIRGALCRLSARAPRDES